jgi:hypothetical protein
MTRTRPPINDIADPFADRAASIDRQGSLDAGSKIYSQPLMRLTGRGALVPQKPTAKSSPKRWSQHVTETSNALDLDPGVFSWSDAKRIAASLKRSAESSQRRKGSPLQSAMSMLNFYINRAGHTLPAKQKRILEKAKDELHQLFGESSP